MPTCYNFQSTKKRNLVFSWFRLYKNLKFLLRLTTTLEHRLIISDCRVCIVIWLFLKNLHFWFLKILVSAYIILELVEKTSGSVKNFLFFLLCQNFKYLHRSCESFFIAVSLTEVFEKPPIIMNRFCWLSVVRDIHFLQQTGQFVLKSHSIQVILHSLMVEVNIHHLQNLSNWFQKYFSNIFDARLPSHTRL